jgi:plastocyanin
MKNTLMAMIVLMVILFTIGCGQSAPATTSVANTSSSTVANQTTQISATTYASKLVSISIENFAFNPKEVTIPVGAKVTWTNNDSATHTITSDTGLFESPEMVVGTWFHFTFDQAGSFAYHCKLHPNMKGTVIVQ